MFRFLNIVISCLLLLTINSCGSGDNSDDIIPPPTPKPTPDPEPDPIGLHINAQLPDDSNETMGIYAVRYNNTSPGTLFSSGNYLNNALLNLNSEDSSTDRWLWPDNSTRLDFYCYAPYIKTIVDVSAVPFVVSENQSEETGKDFFWGKAAAVAPTEATVTVKLSKLTSTIKVRLLAGKGYSSEEVAAAKVDICGLRNAATINLANGRITATGNLTTITPYDAGMERMATVLPQTITDTELIVVSIDDERKTLARSLEIVSGKEYTFDILIEKSTVGMNISLDGWDVIDSDFGGSI